MEPLAAGQDADGSVASDGDIARVGADCVTVTGALPVFVTVGGVSLFPIVAVGALPVSVKVGGVSLFPIVAVGASLCRNKVSLVAFDIP